MPSLSRSTLLFFPVAALMLSWGATGYRSASVDSSGRLHIVLESGGETLPPTMPYQVSFGDPAISADHMTVGWLVLYPYPSPPGSNYVREPIAGALALYQNGRVRHLFRTEQVFYDWQFQGGGKRVAYSTGPTHGGAEECVLRDVDSGKVLAQWWVKRGGDPPAWARPLRF